MITSVETIVAGTFELDGGAMFGVVPKSVWERAYPAQPDSNRCQWATRCLLIRTDDGRNIVVDTGVGDKDGERFQQHFQPSLPPQLLPHLRTRPLHPEEVTDVLFTHLHFDHVGGASHWGAVAGAVAGFKKQGETASLVFPNATHWVAGKQWRWARSPNAREAASFLPTNLDPLEKSGKLRFLPDQKSDFEWYPGIRLRTVFGHTEAMQLPIISLPNGETVVYCADLIPSRAHLSLPWVMAYDVRPLDTLAEKERLINEALQNNWTLLLEHDNLVAGGKLAKDERGRVQLVNTFTDYKYG